MQEYAFNKAHSSMRDTSQFYIQISVHLCITLFLPLVAEQSVLAELVFHRGLAIKVVMASFATAGRWRQEHLTQAFIWVNF